MAARDILTILFLGMMFVPLLMRKYYDLIGKKRFIFDKINDYDNIASISKYIKQEGVYEINNNKYVKLNPFSRYSKNEFIPKNYTTFKIIQGFGHTLIDGNKNSVRPGDMLKIRNDTTVKIIAQSKGLTLSESKENF